MQVTQVVMTAVLLLIPAVASGNVKPHALISEGMVLQQKHDVNIWGTGDPGEKVVVEFRDQQVSTTADGDGKWLVHLESKEAGGPFTLRITGKNEITLKNVLVGEVWVASGQSNMGWPVATRPGSKDLAGTENPSIRLFNVPPKLADSPISDVDGRWDECGPHSLLNFSAVAYYFSREIQATQRVPVGLIHASYGGSGIMAWTGGINATPARDSRLYNGMVAPLLPFRIRGVIWYQGEADVSRAGDYESLFSVLIRSWRQAWGQGDFPFLFVQLAPFKKIVNQPEDSDWAQLREAQLRTSRRVPRTGMAVITDWGHETDIHIKHKRPVGERLARIARVLVYGEELICSGPLFARMNIVGDQAQLGFDHVGNGLTAKRLVLEDMVQDPRSGEKGGALHVAKEEKPAVQAPLQGFTIAGEDRQFLAANAALRGGVVVVSHPQVRKPVAVRYGWANYPIGNLFNSEGLPASPFRTDDWPLTADTRRIAP